MVVVEMQNDLVHESLAEGKGIHGKLATAVRDRGIINRLWSLLNVCRKRGVRVLFATKERHPDIPQPDPVPIYTKLRGSQTPDFLRTGTWGAQIHHELGPADDDIVLPRFTSIDPSYGSELFPVLERLGTKTLVVAGVSTNLAVEGAVRAAANRGYRVVVVRDCCASFPDDWHEFSVRNILPLLAEVVTSGDVEAALEGR